MDGLAHAQPHIELVWYLGRTFLRTLETAGTDCLVHEPGVLQNLDNEITGGAGHAFHLRVGVQHNVRVA